MSFNMFPLLNMELPLINFLGTFARLPIELRLIIWEYLISSIHEQAPKDSLHKGNPLSITRSSRYLYNEISSHLFKNSVQTISLNPEYQEQEWMVIRLKFRTLETQWVLKNKADAEKHFQNFPHSKATMKIHIYAPDPTDPGQVVLIWQKVNSLVDLVVPMNRPDIELTQMGSWSSREPPAHWKRDRKLFHKMGGLQESIKCPYKYHPDYDIAMLPFLRLELWSKDPVKNVPAMSDEQFGIIYRRFVSFFGKTSGIELRVPKILSMTQETAVRRIESILIETNIFLETSLDELPGRTASFLRLERYKNWFENGTSWKSLYETQLRDQLSTCPWVIMNTDPWLSRANRRYITLILLHHALYALKSNLRDGFPLWDNSIIYMRWDSGLWLQIFPDGVAQLSDIQAWLSRFWSEKFLFRKFHAYVDWLGRRRAEEIGEEESRCSVIHRLSLWGH